MTLKHVIEGIKTYDVVGSLNAEILGISSNSNKVGKGFLFAAVKGDTADGHEYIEEAISRGANSILVEKIPEKIEDEISYIKVEDTRSAIPRIASNFFNNPTKHMTLVGVTGTNGKTTLTYLIDTIWREENRKTGLIGTIESRFLNRALNSTLTTPDTIDLYSLFNEMYQSGVKNVSMEVSSHAIDRKRVDGCNFDAVVFTNLTQDHLDYHKSFKNYYNTKKKLFTDILTASDKKEKFAAINIDDEYGRKLIDQITDKVVTYSVDSEFADFSVSEFEVKRNGIIAEINTPYGKLNINSSLLGKHNLYNILGALCVTLKLGSSLDSAGRALNKKVVIPGRLEKIENDRDLDVVVDYAHTPDALKNVIQAIKPLTKGRLITVFGCGGDRDRKKRPIMGRIGFDLSDYLIITSDNPRTELPEVIIEDIKKGINGSDKEKNKFRTIVNREEAIKEAVITARPGDFVLIAGKGHEDYQIIGKEKFHFDDREIAKKHMSKKKI